MGWPVRKKKIPVRSLRIATDVHTHLLPGVDDGRFTFDSAARTLEEMYEAGVRQVCLTPHVIAGLYDSSGSRLMDAVRGVVECTGGEAPVPELRLGAEYMIDETLLAKIREDGGASLLKAVDGDVLIEMSYYGVSLQLFDVVEELSKAGLTPVLAHPERYPYMCRCMERFDMLHEAGCTFQLNLLSVTGVYGEASLRIMDYLFERSYYRYVGSDVHSPEQFRHILSSRMDEKTALRGEYASLWSITE